MRGFLASGAIVVCLMFFSIAGARAEGDRHAGYYYPKMEPPRLSRSPQGRSLAGRGARSWIGS